MNWFLYDIGLRHERVNPVFLFVWPSRADAICTFFELFVSFLFSFRAVWNWQCLFILGLF